MQTESIVRENDTRRTFLRLNGEDRAVFSFMDAPEPSPGSGSTPSATELETIAFEFAKMDAGTTKRGKPRKRRNLAALERAWKLPDGSLHAAYQRALKKLCARAPNTTYPAD